MTKPGKRHREWRAIYDFQLTPVGPYLTFHRGEILYDIEPTNNRLWIGKKKCEDGGLSEPRLLPLDYCYPLPTDGDHRNHVPSPLRQSGTFVTGRDKTRLSVHFSTDPLSNTDALGAIVRAEWIQSTNSTNFNTLRPVIEIFRGVRGETLQPKVRMFLGKIVDVHRDSDSDRVMLELETLGHNVYATLVSRIRRRLFQGLDYVGKLFDRKMQNETWRLPQHNSVDVSLKVKEILQALQVEECSE